MYVSRSDVRTAGVGLLSSTSQVSPLSDDLLNSIIDRCSRFFDKVCGVAPGYFEPIYAPDWESLHDYSVGDLVNPTTKNGHKYRCTTAGSSGASEPDWPTSDAATVFDDLAIFTENGVDAAASAKTIYSTGGLLLPLPPFVSGSASLAFPTNYSAQTFVERNGYLALADANGILYQNHCFAGWYQGVPITVTAIWGYADTPADVKHAVIELAINVFRETDPAGIKLTSLDGGVLRENLPPRVDEVARRYRISEAKAVFV